MDNVEMRSDPPASDSDVLNASDLLPVEVTTIAESVAADGQGFWARLAMCVALLTASNMFMTYAWYGHLRTLKDKPFYIAALVSWGIAFFEYQLQVPANRIGFGPLSVAQLKILQECIALAVFIPFSVVYMREPLRADFIYAAACIFGAVYFVMRDKPGQGGA